MDACGAWEQLLGFVQEVGGLPQLAHGVHGLGALEVLLLDAGQQARLAMQGADGLDEDEVGGIQLQGLLVGFHGAIQAPGTREGFTLFGELLHPEPLEGIYFRLAVAGGFSRGRSSGSREEARGGVGFWPGQGLVIRCGAQACKLFRDGGQGAGVTRSGGHLMSVLERINLLVLITALLRHLEEVKPDLQERAFLGSGNHGAGDGVAHAAPGQLATQGSKETKALFAASRSDHLFQGPFTKGEILFGKLGNLGQRFQGSIGIRGAQFDFRQSL